MTVAQQTFGAALLDPARPVPEGLSDGNARPAGRRFSVYRNNVAVSLTEAMHSAFPVITKLIGDQNMDGIAGIYLRAQPPETPLMMHYGATFPAFLADMPQLAHLGYLPDIARLELALRRSYHAADAAPINPAVLAETAPDALASATIGLAPAVEVLRSDWPIFDIWRFNVEADAPKPRATAQDVLITRPEFDPTPQLLPAGGADLIAALADGQDLGTAHASAISTFDEFDLSATLTLLIDGGAIISLSTKDE